MRRASLAAAIAVLLSAGAASAHTVGLSNGHYAFDAQAQVMSAEITFAPRELVMLLPEIDADHDGELAPDELSAGTSAITRAIVGGVDVTGDGAACRGALQRAWLLEGENGVVVTARYTCPSKPRRLAIAWSLFGPGGLTAGHRQVASLSAAGKTESTVLDGAHATWSRDLAGDSSGAAGIAWSMLKLGFEHILTGYDHLVFLVGLIIVGGTVRSLLGVVTAFTVAHSVTLALAALGVLSPSPRLVEPAIALSIAYVGVENLFVKDASRRWRITFPFGLVHGFGFAGALREIALPHAQVPIALVSFNVGVEIGQMAVLAVALPLTLAARRAPQFGDRGARAVSSTIALAGAVLFVARLFASG
jgi:hydrogenase/urease accessory protein HupE